MIMLQHQEEGCTSYPFAQPQDQETVSVSHSTAFPSPLSLSASQSNNEKLPLSEVDTLALYALKQELSNIPHDEKSALVHVQRIHPELVDDDHLIGFIRAEDFDIDLALKRLLRYWEHRYRVFGPDKFALPMTLQGAMKDNLRSLKQGFLTLLPVLDGAGRAILYSNSSVYKHHNPPTEEKIQVWWYLVHVAMENQSVADKGFIILANSRESRLNNFDAKWSLAASSSGDRNFPIRWKMAHVCHANAVFPYVASAVKAVLSRRQRKSFILHNGSNERVLESLSEYLLPKYCIPTDMGGTLHVSTEDFVRKRLQVEGGAIDSESDYEMNYSTTGDASSIHHQQIEQGINIEETTSSCPSIHLGSLKYGNESTRSVSSLIEHQCEKTETSLTTNIPTPPSIPDSNMKESPVQKPSIPKPKQKKAGSNNGNKPKKSQAKKKKSDKGKSHPGRMGDPRMNRAVQAKMEDPNLSLVAALVVGGFVFPGMDAPGVKLSTVLDEDNVTVYQRRNQLLRRMRLARKKS